MIFDFEYSFHFYKCISICHGVIDFHLKYALYFVTSLVLNVIVFILFVGV